MLSTTTLSLVNGVRIVVPESIDNISTYVLSEQQDWFEDEIKFLRSLIQPGQKVIDIGANYGVYTLSMAQTVGSSGHVWAFEPASSTARLLRESITENCFSHVTLGQFAISSAKGKAHLYLDQDSVMNSLSPEHETRNSETVNVMSLDDCLKFYDWRNIDFIKIDAEGGELNILKGGTRFFSDCSPLVQYEVSDKPQFRQQVEQEFIALGYKTYRLVPGLNTLRPFDVMIERGDFLLNLFCCKQDCADRLAARGFLVDDVELSTNETEIKKLSEKIRVSPEYNWRVYLGSLPYGESLAYLWRRTTAAGHSCDVENSLSFYAASRDSSLSVRDRFCALKICYSRFKELCNGESSFLRLASFGRVARAFGARAEAADALGRQWDIIMKDNQVHVEEPFLVPSERFDTLPPGDAFAKWISTAILEEYERIRAYSTYYTGDSSLHRLEAVRDSGFSCEEMKQRLKMLQMRLTQAGYYKVHR